MLDHYIWGKSDRISPEAPVPVINKINESFMIGGAGNVVKNIRSFGFNVDLISVLGSDSISKKIVKQLANINVNDKKILKINKRKGIIKTRIVAANQQVVRIDSEQTHDISLTTQNKLLNIFKKCVHEFDVILLSDYNKGVLTEKLTSNIINICNDLNKKVLVDPKGDNYDKYSGAFLLTPNKKEAKEVNSIEINSKETLTESLKYFKSKYNLKYSLITLSEDGIALYNKKLKIFPTKAKQVFDVTGAGDTVLASLGIGILSGLSIEEAVSFSNLCAGVVISKVGSSTTNLKEVINFQSSNNENNSVLSTNNFVKQIIIHKSENKKIVFTNGCFDILHAGHVEYLKKAKEFGDILVVGINSDSSVKKIKGKDRPVNNQKDRSFIVSQLKCVDYVTIFNDETPINLIKKVKPDFLIKGSDYKKNQVVGKEYSKKIILIDLVEGKSTSGIIKKIKCQK